MGIGARIMTRRISPETPVADLLKHADIPRIELSRRLGITQSSVPGAIARGSGVRLDWLMAAADACGFALDIRLVPKKRQATEKK